MFNDRKHTGSNLKRGLPVALPCDARHRHARLHADGAAAADDGSIAEMLRIPQEAFLRNEAKWSFLQQACFELVA